MLLYCDTESTDVCTDHWASGAAGWRGGGDRASCPPHMVGKGYADTITRGLMAVRGVQKVVPEVKEKRVRVLYHPQQASDEALRDSLKRLGYL